MGANLELLAVLQQKLTTAEDFSEVMNYFFDHFAENDEFMDAGERTHDEQLDAILQKSAQSLAGKNASYRTLFAIRIAKHRFIHGACLVNGQMGNFFYFEKTLSGMMAVLSGDKSGMTHYTRIQAVAFPNNRSAKWN
jgi:hypothetical protein